MTNNQSKIERLIAELCPNGVEFKELNDIAAITTGKLNANAMVANGKYPFFTCAEKPFLINDYAFDTEAILISGNGSQVGHINYFKGKFNAYQRTYVLSDFAEDIHVGFLLHFLRGYLKEYILKNAKEGSVPYITLPMLHNFKTPVPPLKIQEKIVDILDKFTQLEAELEAELEARKKQYEYYRDELSNIRGVEYKTLREIGTLIRGSGLQKKDFTETGVGCVHYGQIYTQYGTFADKTKTFTTPELAKKLKKAQKGDVLIAGVSENIEDVCKPLGWLGDEICISGDMFAFQHNQNTKFITFLLQTTNFFKHKRKYAQGAKVTRVKADRILDFKIPIPSMDEQKRIAETLEKFDILTGDMSIGLPAEIKARRQQYEYYRGKLLTFNELEK